MGNLSTDLTGKYNGANPDYKAKVQSTSQGIEHLAKTTGERVGAMANNFAHSAADSMNSSREYVKENPVKGVAIAAAVGMVAGSLLTIAARGRKS